MENEKDLKKQLYELAKKQVEEKMQKTLKEQEKKLDEDIEELSKLIFEVENNVLYTENGKEYRLVTKDVLFNDYKEKPYIYYNTDFRYYSYYVKVGEKHYHHVGKIIQNHLENIEKAVKLSLWELERLNEKKDLVNRLTEQHKNIIDIYNEYEKNTKKREDYE